MSYPTPTNETERLVAVRALNILGTAPEIAFDDIGELAAQICQCSVSYITFADDDRFWLKAKYGLPPDFNECPREISFCATTICGTVMIIAPNLREDDRFNQFPTVTGEPHLQFYCGIPLVTKAGYALGTLTFMDFEPRQLTFEQTEALHRLIRFPGDHLGLAIFGHQWKPVWRLIFSRSVARAAHRDETISSRASRVAMCLLTMGSSTSVHSVSAGCTSGV